MHRLPRHQAHARGARALNAACGVAALAALWACAGTAGVPGDAAGALPAPGSRGDAVPEPSAARIDLGGPRTQAGRLDPDILLPKSPAKDGVVATVRGVEIHKSHVYERLLETSRRSADLYVDMLVVDVVVAEQATKHGVRVDGPAVDALVQGEEQTLRQQVEREWGKQLSFDQYLARQTGMTLPDYRSYLRLELARQMYRGLVIRFLAMLEDRVEVRFIVNEDRTVLEEVRQKVLDGADFATLAMRHSEDETRRDGGRMAPFGSTFDHPIAKVAFGLQPGGLSAVFEFEHNGAPRHGLVYCLRRMPKREVTFAEVRQELILELRARPLSPFEQKAFTLRWCGEIEPLNSDGTPR